MPMTSQLAAALIAGVLSIATVHAQTANSKGEHPAADNTAANANDRGTHAQTPMDQGNDEDSLAVTAAIRKALLNDSSLSMSAHNVKIITNGNNVTLRGPVASVDEKKRVEALAVKTAAGKHVRNEISVAG